MMRRMDRMTELPAYCFRRRRVARQALLLLALGILAIFLCCCVGSARLTLRELGEAVWARLRGLDAPDRTADTVLFGIRLPRTITSYFVGMALAGSGVLMQGVFANPMAEPGVLGVSSGAALGAAVAMIFRLETSPLGFSVVSLFAFFFGAAAVVVVLLFSPPGRGTTSLLLSGIAVSTILSAVVSGLLTLNHDKMEAVYMWTMGSFASSSWNKLLLLAPVIVLGLLLSQCFSRDLNALLAGNNARLLGVNAARVRLCALALSTLLTAAAVSMSGVIGFVGLMAPHAVRRLTGADHRSLLPLSALAGGLFLLIADTLARTVFMPTELPVGVVTSLFGGPFFLILLRGTRGGRR